jgi:hypothetical protein
LKPDDTVGLEVTVEVEYVELFEEENNNFFRSMRALAVESCNDLIFSASSPRELRLSKGVRHARLAFPRPISRISRELESNTVPGTETETGTDFELEETGGSFEMYLGACIGVRMGTTAAGGVRDEMLLAGEKSMNTLQGVATAAATGDGNGKGDDSVSGITSGDDCGNNSGSSGGDDSDSGACTCACDDGNEDSGDGKGDWR